MQEQAQNIIQVTEINERGQFEIDLEDLANHALLDTTADPWFMLVTATGTVLVEYGIDEMVRDDSMPDSMVFNNVILPNGSAGRLLRWAYVPRIEEPSETNDPVPLVLSLATTREPLDTTLRSVLAGIVVAGVVLLIITIPVVLLAVNWALGRLHQLQVSVENLDVDKLDQRLPEQIQPKEVRPLVAALNRAFYRIDEAYQREKRFTADAAHELRTPIAELRTLAEVELQRLQNTDDSSQIIYLNDILAISKQLDVLVSALLAIARSEEIRKSVPDDMVDLAALTAYTLAGLQDRTGSVCTIQTRLPDHVQIKSSAELLKSMFSNLMINACHYTNDHERIAIELATHATSITWSISNPTQSLQTVDLADIAKPFWQKDENRSGTERFGLGLTLVEAYANALGIKVRYDLTTDNLFRATLEFPTPAIS